MTSGMTTRAKRHQEHAGNYVLSPGADLNLGVDIIQIPSDDELKCISKQCPKCKRPSKPCPYLHIKTLISSWFFVV